MWHLKFVAALSINITAFWDMTSCILVDTFVRSVVTQLHLCRVPEDSNNMLFPHRLVLCLFCFHCKLIRSTDVL
jgi:hypothetical protein